MAKLCLDFVNTIEGRIGREPEDFLNRYTDIAHWAEHSGLLTSLQADDLIERAAADSQAAEAAFRSAVALRETIYRIFYAHAHKQLPDESALQALQASYAAGMLTARLSPQSNSYQWQWPAEDLPLRGVEWQVAQVAVDLLFSGEMRRIKECPGDHDCGWLFYDESKNVSRRWCSMEGCGNRIKARRHYARQQAA